ncbi:MAG: DNA-binding protein [Opitutaceae bacterium]|jgi:predicted nucleic acid-binding protein|nr:DNA-binding protein [Opitutaceae bacterium]
MPGNPTLAAVDTNVLLDLALPRDVVHDAISLMRRRLAGGCVFAVLPAVLEELRHIQEADSGPAGTLARHTLETLLRDRTFQPVDFTSVGYDIIECAAGRILDARLLPSAERHDAEITAQAALADCQILLTSDNHLLDIPPDRLRLLLRAQDMGCPIIVSPQKVVRDFFPRR